MRMMKLVKILKGVSALLMVGALVGGVLHLQMREHFVQMRPGVEEPYWGLALLFGIPATLLALWIAPSLKKSHGGASRSLRAVNSFRAVLFVPFGAVLMASMVATAPIGYLYLWGYLTGSEVLGIKATVVDSESLHTFRKGCRQRLGLSINGREERVCVEDRVVGALPYKGQVVLIRGIVSPVGIWVKEVRADQ